MSCSHEINMRFLYLLISLCKKNCKQQTEWMINWVCFDWIKLRQKNQKWKKNPYLIFASNAFFAHEVYKATARNLRIASLSMAHSVSNQKKVHFGFDRWEAEILAKWCTLEYIILPKFQPPTYLSGLKSWKFQN